MVQQEEYLGYTSNYRNGNVIEFCYNTGTISGYTCVGGIAGAAWNSNGEIVKMTHLYNTGTINMLGNRDMNGGIIGGTYYNLTGQTVNGKNTLNFSYNIGDVNCSRPNQITGGWLVAYNVFYINGRTNTYNIGTPKDASLFKAPLSNANSVLYELNKAGNMWTVDKNYNSGNVVFIWQVNKIL